MPASARPGRPTTTPRLRLLRLLDGHGHRYVGLRALGQAFTLCVLVGVPLLGIARVVVWGGRHALLTRPAPLKHAIAGVLVGIVGMYGFTFLVNLAAGRLFCGWGCPVGQVSRWGDACEVPGQSPSRRRLRYGLGALYSAAFVMSIMAWWVDLRVLALGTPREIAIAWSVLGLGLAGAWMHGKWWRWGFCKSICPIGLYYCVVAPASYFGVHFRNAQGSCLDCHACDRVCPVALDPRNLGQAATQRPGLSVSDAPQRNHCLECGDCIRACEHMIEAAGGDRLVPLRLGWHAGPLRIDAGDGPRASGAGAEPECAAAPTHP